VLGAWLKWQSSCLASQTSNPIREKNKEEKKGGKERRKKGEREGRKRPRKMLGTG
jgi:hypothetical protein